MPTEIVIRPAAENDLLLLRPLLVELTEAMTDTEGFDIEQSMKNCRVLIGDSAQRMLVAQQENQIIGLVNFMIRKTLMHPGPSGLIDELIVSASGRGKGIGSLLVQAVIDKCREAGCCEVEVSTEKSNTRARKFYKRCGFDEDAVLLEIDL